MPSFYIVTLGCKVNQYETQALREAWLRQGLVEAEAASKADVLVVNSCAITAKAVADVRATIRKLHRDQPLAPVVVTGCAAEVMGQELAAIAGVRRVVPHKEKALLLKAETLLPGFGTPAAGKKATIAEPQSSPQPFCSTRETADGPHDCSPKYGGHCAAAVTGMTSDNARATASGVPSGNASDNASGNASAHASDKSSGKESPRDSRNDSAEDTGNHNAPHVATSASNHAGPVFPPFEITGYDRSRAVLKIQDGCSHCCTYCIVPRARGGSVSRPLGDALDEAGRLLEAGFAEIVISGVNLRQFQLGHQASPQDNNEDFWLFIEALEERFGAFWAGKARFRISSLEPGQLTKRAVAVLGESRLVAPHLHLSLQSGSDTVLDRMGRGHYTVADVRAGLHALSAVRRPFGLGADIISGFPGETEDEHKQTVQLLTELPLTYAHVFPYSRRPHTLAARMPQQVEGPVKKRRAAELRALARAKQQQFVENMLTMPHMQVAVEQAHNQKGRAHGVNQWYVECEFINDAHTILTPEQRKRHAAVLKPAVPVAIEQGRLLVRAD